MDRIESNTPPPHLIEVKMIWDKSPHNAFTDLIYFQGRWFCTFREADVHEKGLPGNIRIITSQDGDKWETCSFFHYPPYDLRDPKLTPTPDGKLMLLVGSTHLDEEQKYLCRESLVSFSLDGTHWTPFHKVTRPHDWLWRVIWSRGVCYGVTYRFSNFENLRDEWHLSLWKSDDGMNFEEICQWEIKGRPNETTLRVMDSGEMIALVRRNQCGSRHCMIGTSWPPYDRWKWKKADIHLGGPNFVIVDDHAMWASGRMMFFSPYGYIFKTVLARMTRASLKPQFLLPSDGDTSYPGMVVVKNQLWMSYYSSHEHKTAVYLAKIELGV